MSLQNYVRGFCLVFTLFAPSLASAQTPTDEQIALQFTPSVVTDDVATSHTFHPKVRVAVQRADLDHSGSMDYLIAAYSGVESGGLSVIRRLPTPVVVAEADAAMGGVSVRLQQLDIDRDGIPEILVSFGQVRGSNEAWLFKWNSSALLPLFGESISGPVFEDLDGDGVFEIIAGAPKASSVVPIYKMTDGHFIPTDPIVLYSRVYRSSSPKTVEFTVPDSQASYVLRVVNGDHSGANRVVGGEVRLNDQVVVNAGDLAGSAPMIVPITVQKTNTLVIRVDSPDHSQLMATIAPAAPLAQPRVHPVVQCVWDEGAGLFTANFGFDNPSEERVIVVDPADNLMQPAPSDRGQPAVFEPGHHDDVFWVQSNGETLIWSLNGFTASASLESSPRCAGDAPAQRQGNACVDGTQTSPAASEIPWIDDSVAAGMPDSFSWTDTYVTSGSLSIHIPYGAGDHGVNSVGASSPVAVNPADALVVYLLINRCLMPDEIEIRWHDTAGAWHGAWWGTAHFNDESQLKSEGGIPTPGDWERIEIPASDVLPNAFLADGVQVRLFGGEVWIDRFAVLPSPSSVNALSVPANVQTGASFQGTVTLSGRAGFSGAAVSLSSDSTAVFVPSSTVFVQGGVTSATFTGYAMGTSATTAHLTASYNGGVSAAINVSNGVANVVITPSSVIGGSVATGRITLAAPAPAGGQSVSLSSSDASRASVPLIVTVIAGATTAVFPINTFSGINPATVTITASTANSSAQAVVTVNPCTLGVATAPEIPSGDTVRFDDEMPSGMTGGFSFDTSQKASGTQSLQIGYGTGSHGSGFGNATQPFQVLPGGRLVFNMLMNPCARPREVEVSWAADT